MGVVDALVPQVKPPKAVDRGDPDRVELRDRLVDACRACQADRRVALLIIIFRQDERHAVGRLCRVQDRRAVIAHDPLARPALLAGEAVGGETDLEGAVRGVERRVAVHFLDRDGQCLGDRLLEQQAGPFLGLPALDVVVVPEPIALKQEDPRDGEGDEADDEAHP